jgi:hypothetical protein
MTGYAPHDDILNSYWIGEIKSACKVTASGVETENDGKTEAKAAFSCQGILDAFGDDDLADEDKRFLLRKGKGRCAFFDRNLHVRMPLVSHA